MATWALAILLGLGASAAPTNPPPIVILIPPGSLTASVAARYLAGELEQATAIEARANLDADAWAAQARAVWPDSVLIVLDPARSETRILRPNDSTLLVRALADQPNASPYALAVAAAELVRLAVLEAQGVTTPAPPSEPTELELALSIALALSWAPSDEPALIQPLFAADLRVGKDGLWSAIGVRVRSPASFTQDSAGAQIEYRRTDLSGHIAFGPKFGELLLLVGVEAGASLERVRALQNARLLGDSARTPFWIGAGVDVQYTIWGGLQAQLGLLLGRVLSPADFLGDDRLLLSEGSWRAHATLGLAWVL